jgi:hypothetical protein
MQMNTVLGGNMTKRFHELSVQIAVTTARGLQLGRQIEHLEANGTNENDYAELGQAVQLRNDLRLKIKPLMDEWQEIVDADKEAWKEAYGQTSDI